MASTVERPTGDRGGCRSTRVGGGGGPTAPRGPWGRRVDGGEAGGSPHERRGADLKTRGDHAAEELAAFRDDIEVGARAEIDHDGGTTERGERREGVHHSVCTDLAWVVRDDRYTGLHAGADDHGFVREIARRHLSELAGHVGHHACDAETGDVVAEVEIAMLEKSGKEQRQLVGRSFGTRR